jgi:tetratricopeptide (TPR) repeat protein
VRRRVVAVPRPDPTRTAPPQAPPPRAKYLEALAQYEQGFEALQRHDYATAAEHFLHVVDGYPEERELHERARLYLNVCQERLSNGVPPTPTSVEERVFASTLALNAGRHQEALEYLRGVDRDDPDHDYAQYLLAVAKSARGELDSALEHLRRAILLNPENRALALSDADLAPLRAQESFRLLLESLPAAPNRRRLRRARS